MFSRLIIYFCFLISCPGIFAQTRTAAFYDAAAYTAFRTEAAKIAASLDDNDLAAQVLLSGIDGKSSLVPAMRSLLERIPAGGIMLFRYNLDTSRDDVKKLLKETAGLAAGKTGIPPFIAVDHEGGLVHRFGPDVERLPSAFSFWEFAEEKGRYAALFNAETLYLRSAREIRDLGITMVLGPVAETLNEENRLFLETRSYGPDPGFTQAAASAYLRRMNMAGIACALKHFPGNTAADPHSGASTLRAGKTALDEMVKPFAGIISRHRPEAILLSHVMVPVIDNRRIASLSRPVIEDWLRGELGFDGIVLADDFSMGAVIASGINPAAAVVEALNAGVDMIMVWPKDLSSAHGSILKALREGYISRERLREAAGRIIAAKMRNGLLGMDNE